MKPAFPLNLVSVSQFWGVRIWAGLSKAIFLPYMELTGVAQCLLWSGRSDVTHMPYAFAGVGELEALDSAGAVSLSM